MAAAMFVLAPVLLALAARLLAGKTELEPGWCRWSSQVVVVVPPASSRVTCATPSLDRGDGTNGLTYTSARGVASPTSNDQVVPIMHSMR
jgi:hypothetical protein